MVIRVLFKKSVCFITEFHNLCFYQDEEEEIKLEINVLRKVSIIENIVVMSM